MLTHILLHSLNMYITGSWPFCNKDRKICGAGTEGAKILLHLYILTSCDIEFHTTFIFSIQIMSVLIKAIMKVQ